MVKKSRKHTRRGNHYQTMAEGYQLLRSPLADSYNAAAEHYHASDPPFDPLAEAKKEAKEAAADIPAEEWGPRRLPS